VHWFGAAVRVLVLGTWCTQSKSHLKTAWCARTRSVTLCLVHVVMLLPAPCARHESRSVYCVRSQFSLEQRYTVVFSHHFYILLLAVDWPMAISVYSSSFCKTDCQHTASYDMRFCDVCTVSFTSLFIFFITVSKHNWPSFNTHWVVWCGFLHWNAFKLDWTTKTPRNVNFQVKNRHFEYRITKYYVCHYTISVVLLAMCSSGVGIL